MTSTTIHRIVYGCLIVIPAWGAMGCGPPGDDMPPADPIPVQRQTTQDGRDAAQKLLEAVKKKDATEVAAIRKEIESKLRAAIRQSSIESEHDYGRLTGFIALVDQGQWSKAEAHLKSLIENSMAPAAEDATPDKE